MAELPTHPDERPAARVGPVRSGSRWRTVSWVTLAVVVVLAAVVLHLTGVLGAGAHA